MASAYKEIEVKYRLDSFGPVKEKLLSLGFKSSGDIFQRDILFDTQDKKLKEQGKTLRVRKDTTCKVTLKQRPKEEDNKYRIREELEFEVEDPGMMTKLLNGLGFQEFWIYEKYRETFKKEGIDAEVVLDKMPFLGAYLEIEGPKEEIDKISESLGMQSQRLSVLSYRRLAMKHFEDKSLPFLNLTFEEEKKHGK